MTTITHPMSTPVPAPGKEIRRSASPGGQPFYGEAALGTRLRQVPSVRRPSIYVPKPRSNGAATSSPGHAPFSRAPWSAVGSRPTRAWRNWQTRWV
jgi:hypothetical protein